jgi:translocation and assembly module TamA
LRFVQGRRALALFTAAALFVASAGLPVLAFELFGRTFFERNDETAVVPDAQPYALDISVAGGDRDLVKAIRAASALVRDAKKPPPGTAGLIAQARGDYGRIVAALYSRGYYGGTVSIAIEGVPAEEMRPDTTLPDPVPVAIAVDPGPLFRFGAIDIDGMPPGPMTREDEKALDLDEWELVQGEVARSGAILFAEARLVETWRQRGHPIAAVAKRNVVADHRTHLVDVTLVVAPGPEARFGAVEVTGTERVDLEYARFMTGIPPGTPYDPDVLERARKRMQDTGAFASVGITEGETVGPDGLLPVTFNLTERKRHLIGGGVSYATIDGATLEGYWMHRNLFGHAESLRFDASISRIFAEDLTDLSYTLATTFRRPGVFTPDTDATLRLLGEREFVDTYESRTIAGRAGFEHRFNEKITVSSAANAEWDDIEDAFGDQRYVLVSLPSRFDYDGRDNKLDPTEGLRGTFDAEPFADILGGTVAVVARGQISGYYALREGGRMVFAARGAAGTIVGGDAEDIPATRRFYLGGGGSIRGYEYRTVGPEIGGEVVGGLSFVEASIELRLRITDTIGIVPFIDVGVAYEDPLPDFSEEFRIGAGVGLRYHTPLGPLRFDIAVPLNPEDDEASFAFYVGLGQSF